MKGIIETDGFIIGEKRIHTETLEYAWVNIIKIGLSEDIRNTGRRTWIKYNFNKYGSDNEKETKNNELVLKPGRPKKNVMKYYPSSSESEEEDKSKKKNQYCIKSS